MPSVVSAVSVPVLLLLSLPLAAFAVFTTSVAFWVLLFRVSLVYAELLAALLRSYIVPPPTESVTDVRSPSPEKDRSPRSRRASQSSSGSSGLQMRTFGPSDSSTILAGLFPPRDYEGVGGWLAQDDDEDEPLWIAGDSHPGPPSPVASLQRHHSYSQTSLSRGHSGVSSPELVRSPLALRTTGRSRGPGSGTASPEGYFSTPLKLLASGGDRASKVSFEDQIPSTVGSTVSLSSVKITRQDLT
ncbi:hypothetical protein B0A55_01344 [Friedmanniomyces simplex]|uniref:Uncharacterized protein n=1 Tax=Friedmanniomyces simplex TaxID=329884 RepID=A0A4U0XV20_9PEZI|nr:hypothetical protein B0A55_01344 [Friedmanniomyces simplex]